MAHDLGPPAGFYRTTWDWACTCFTNPSELQQHYMKFEFEDTIFHAEPKAVDEPLYWRFRQFMHDKPLPQFVAVIPEGRVVGADGTVISPDNKLLWDVSLEFLTPPHMHTIFARPQLPPVAYTSETVAVLTSTGSYNYYHWMFEVIARIDLLRRSGLEIDKYVINRHGSHHFQEESLAVLGILKEKIIECHDFTHIQAKKLVVPSLAGHTGHPPKWACDFLRTEFLAKRNIQPLSGYERIYISRADARHRKVVNDAEVTNLLAEYGFRSIQLETLSLFEQAQIFSSAQTIVSPHGAGLTNLLFCRPGTKVIEFFAPYYVIHVYWILSNQVGLDYCYLIGEGERPPDHTDIYVFHENIRVNLSALKKTLHFIGLNAATPARRATIAHTLQHLFQKEDAEFVTELYRELFNREPDPPGLRHHVKLLRSGIAKTDVVTGMLQSKEANLH